jgi:uncharacterized protein YxeA
MNILLNIFLICFIFFIICIGLFLSLLIIATVFFFKLDNLDVTDIYLKNNNIIFKIQKKHSLLFI